MAESKQPDPPKPGPAQQQQQPVTVMGTPQAAGDAAEPKPTAVRPDPTKPSETRPGGLYVKEDRKTVVDAEGRKVDGFKVDKDGSIVEGKAPKSDDDED